MPSTNVHFPESLLEELDEFAAEKGLSRNRLIVEACRESLQKRREWPSGFFDDSRFHGEELEELRGGARAFEAELAEALRTREVSPF